MFPSQPIPTLATVVVPIPLLPPLPLTAACAAAIATAITIATETGLATSIAIAPIERIMVQAPTLRTTRTTSHRANCSMKS